MIYTGPSIINHKHPISFGLQHAWLFGRNGNIAPDLIGNNHIIPNTSVSSNYVNNSSIYGNGWLLNGSFYGIPLYQYQMNPYAGAIIVVGQAVGDLSGRGLIISGWGGVQFWIGQSTGPGAAWECVFGSIISGNGIIRGGDPFVLCLSWYNINAAVMSFPMVGEVSYISGTPSSSNYNAVNLQFGNLTAFGSMPPNCILNCCYIYNRYVTPEEIQFISSDPYTIFRKRSISTSYMGGTSSGGTAGAFFIDKFIRQKRLSLSL